MNNEIIISGLTVAQIKSKAQYILETEVIPKAELFEIRKREGRLSKEVNDILKKQNAWTNLIAGCNGAGKSTFAKSFLPANETSFDYDRTFLEFYNSLPDSELRENFAQQKVNELFQSEIEFALSHGLNFCYETNFDEYPLYWAEQFKAKGYSVRLIFFCLESVEIAQRRLRKNGIKDMQTLICTLHFLTKL